MSDVDGGRCRENFQNHFVEPEAFRAAPCASGPSSEAFSLRKIKKWKWKNYYFFHSYVSLFSVLDQDRKTKNVRRLA